MGSHALVHRLKKKFCQGLFTIVEIEEENCTISPSGSFWLRKSVTKLYLPAKSRPSNPEMSENTNVFNLKTRIINITRR